MEKDCGRITEGTSEDWDMGGFWKDNTSRYVMAFCICTRDEALRSSSTPAGFESSDRGASFCVWPLGGIVGIWVFVFGAFESLMCVVLKKV